MGHVMRTLSVCSIISLAELSSSLKVGIIGGGIGGASTAHHLRQHFGSDVSIQVFDEGPIGGRVHSVDVDNAYFEGGASIIHKRNRYMRHFVKMLNLSELDMDGKQLITVFNGVKPAFVGSSWSWLTAMKLLWRYGPDIVRIQWTISAMMDKFDAIYRMQENGEAFADLDSMLTAWNKEFPDLLNQSLHDFLNATGFSARFIDELANAATRNNYNQRASNLHAFVGQVALAGFLPGLFAVRGGNALVVRRLLEASGAELVPHAVTAVEETSGTLSRPSFALHLAGGAVHGGFDAVVLAAPRHPGAAWPKFVNVQPHLPPLRATPYQPVTATFVRGALNDRHFRLPPAGAPYAVFMSGRADTDPVSSVALHQAVSGPATAWKVFSASADGLSEDALRRLFAGGFRVAARKSWPGAYPRYAVPTRTDGLRFLLAPGLVCLYPVEQAASAMEMSAIAGANAALLLKHSARPGGKGGVRGEAGNGRAETTSRASGEL